MSALLAIVACILGIASLGCGIGCGHESSESGTKAGASYFRAGAALIIGTIITAYLAGRFA